MTIHEYKERLSMLSSEELQKFNDDFGGGEMNISQRVRSFVDHPEHERRICQLLNLKTEQEKLTNATLLSADAADRSARSANKSMIWSAIATIVALLALLATVVSIVGLPKKESGSLPVKEREASIGQLPPKPVASDTTCTGRSLFVNASSGFSRNHSWRHPV